MVEVSVGRGLGFITASLDAMLIPVDPEAPIGLMKKDCTSQVLEEEEYFDFVNLRAVRDCYVATLHPCCFFQAMNVCKGSGRTARFSILFVH